MYRYYNEHCENNLVLDFLIFLVDIFKYIYKILCNQHNFSIKYIRVQWNGLVFEI